jgi:hypothetical protein
MVLVVAYVRGKDEVRVRFPMKACCTTRWIEGPIMVRGGYGPQTPAVRHVPAKHNRWCARLVSEKSGFDSRSWLLGRSQDAIDSGDTVLSTDEDHATSALYTDVVYVAYCPMRGGGTRFDSRHRYQAGVVSG